MTDTKDHEHPFHQIAITISVKKYLQKWFNDVELYGPLINDLCITLQKCSTDGSFNKILSTVGGKKTLDEFDNNVKYIKDFDTLATRLSLYKQYDL